MVSECGYLLNIWFFMILKMLMNKGTDIGWSLVVVRNIYREFLRETNYNHFVVVEYLKEEGAVFHSRDF